MKDEIYQFKISLPGSEPLVWRQVLVRHDETFESFHRIIQHVLGWGNYHMYVFTLKKKHILMPEMNDEEDSVYANEVSLNEMLTRAGQKFKYLYDFGDKWEHEILFEKKLPLEAGTFYPRCINGERAHPIEDCGGVWRFNEIVANPVEELARMEWDMKYDPLEFSTEAVNKRFRKS